MIATLKRIQFKDDEWLGKMPLSILEKRNVDYGEFSKDTVYTNQFSFYLWKLILYYNGKKSKSFKLKSDQPEVIQSMNLP